MTQVKTLFVAFSHTLTAAQIEDASVSLGIQRIVSLRDVDQDLQSEFSQVPARASRGEIIRLARKIVQQAEVCGATHIFVAGEPSLFLHTCLSAQSAGIVVVQSTTERVSSESLQSDGTVVKTAVFSHVQWREIF